MRRFTTLNNSISKISSKTLCVIIALHQTFNMNKEILQKCMEELVSRRIAGEVFKYEEVIDEHLKEFKSGELLTNELFD